MKRSICVCLRHENWHRIVPCFGVCFLSLIAWHSIADDSADVASFHDSITEEVAEGTRQAARDCIREQFATVIDEFDEPVEFDTATPIGELYATGLPCRFLMRRDILSSSRFADLPDYAAAAKKDPQFGALAVVPGADIEVLAFGRLDTATANALQELDIQPRYFEMGHDTGSIQWMFEHSPHASAPEATVVIRYPCVTEDGVECVVVCIETWSMRVTADASSLEWYLVSGSYEIMIARHSE